MRLKYYGAKLDKPIFDLCDELKRGLNLSDFSHDAHNSWEYAFAKGEGYFLNVTQTEDFDTIKQWMNEAPDDINYQVVLGLKDNLPEEDSKRVEDSLFKIVGSGMTLYLEGIQPDD